MKKSSQKPEMTVSSSTSILPSVYSTSITSTNTSPSDDITIIKTKIENATEGLSRSCFNYLSNRVLPASKENALTICDYISCLKSEINPSSKYRKDTINSLEKRFLSC